VRKVKLDYVEEPLPTTNKRNNDTIVKVVVIKDEVQLFHWLIHNLMI